MRAHRAISRAGIGCDVLPVAADLTGYRLVVVPALVLLSDSDAARLAAAAAAGTHVVVTYFSGIADRSDRVVAGGYPGQLRDLLGVRTEEFFPLGSEQQVRWDDGTISGQWAEDTAALPGTEVLARYVDGPTPGFAALTRRPVGQGAAWYLSSEPDAAGFARVLARIAAQAGAHPAIELPAGPATTAGLIDVIRRRSGHGSWLFALNHSATAVTLSARGLDLVTGRRSEGELTVPGGGCAVIRED